ncbi:MAG TPA: ABC transporter permease [Geodermatophilus sp.]|nr:ABC transporter permease [Geodermatophilus sp.]
MTVGFLEFLQSRSDDIVTLGLQHLAIVLVAVALATVIGVALGIATYRTERPREIVLAVAGAFLTIPSFALLVLFIGPLGLGATNVVVALTMYGLLPILRNTIIGLRGVDPAIVESAMGMGLDRRQRLLRIELPLAWPVIITGMQVSTLILVGGAAIGAVVLGPGYGELIFAGLYRVGTDVAIDLVLAGVLGVVLVAVVFEVLFNVLRRLTTSRGLR